MMQSAHVVFLDEVFKGSSAILNALLSFMNERAFYDRGRRHSVPLQCLFAATNELPDSDELQAIWDRFTLRCRVENVPADRGRIQDLLAKAWPLTYGLDEAQEPRSRAFSAPRLLEELQALRDTIRGATGLFDPEADTLGIVTQLVELARTHGLSQVSNRRMVKFVYVMLVHRVYDCVRAGETSAAAIALRPEELRLLPKYFLDQESHEEGVRQLHAAIVDWHAERAGSRMIDVRLVPPSVWGPEIACYAEPGNSNDPWTDPGRLAHAALWVLQDAHVGITPKLAHELGRLFARNGPAEPGVWSKLFRRLQERLPRTGRSGLVAGRAPVYVVQNLVKPIVREACAEIGYTCLLCQDDTDGAVTADEYAAYGASLERIASRIAAQLAAGPLFAAEHGNVVAALSEPSPDGPIAGARARDRSRQPCAAARSRRRGRFPGTRLALDADTELCAEAAPGSGRRTADASRAFARDGAKASSDRWC